ncbi:MAG: threonine--tRNA ligase [Bacilli bacterium]|nr:threonine--tRNA ligase [Bacilli bacterium]
MINIKENEQLSIKNHSCAHLLAQAVKHLYPDAKFWVGPVIEEGFYYDIDLGDYKLTDEDIPKIEKEMKKIAKDGKRIVRQELSKEEALEKFKDDEYKIDLISRMDEEDTVISCYSQGDFTDLCRGPHVETVKELKYFKLLKFSGAYWKGDANNKMLQRIYGICFDTEEELEAHLQELEEAKQRDHRKIGKEQELFMSHELVGSGMPLWLPNGAIIRKELENYIYAKERNMGYNHVYTPCVGTTDLYKTSGHWDHYQENMFPTMKVDDEEFVLRPMNCPHHMLVYKNKMHSYRDLPIKIGELAHDFRYEDSGSVCGLERVRQMCQNDAHLFVRPDQIKEEVGKVLRLIVEVYQKDFGFPASNFEYRLSLRDKENKEKYIDNDEMWETAESQLREILTELEIPFYEAKGEAAFYGPKIDIQIKTALNHDVTIPTCQLDFALPERFELEYIGEDGEKHRPVVIHRAILGSSDRFISFLLEETKGFLPTWLAPTQVKILPITDKQHEYAYKLKEELIRESIRVEVDDRNEKTGYKIREAQLSKVPYMLIIGAKEVEENTVSVRLRENAENETIKLKEFLEKIKKEIKEKRK